MRFLFTVLLFMLMVVPSAYGRITLLPSDDTAGGGSGDIYWFMNFGGSSANWPNLNNCLVSTGGGASYRQCASTDAPDHRNGTPYFGQVFVRYLVCTPMQAHTAWGSDASLSLAVYETQGSNGEGNFVRRKLGGDVTFDQTDGIGVSDRVIINLTTTLSGGTLQVRFSVVGTPPIAPDDNGFSCVIALTE